MPKRTKFRKMMKGRNRGEAHRGNSLAYGDFGIKAMDLAIKRQATSQKDFLDLFQQAYEEIDKDARLAAIFSTFDLKDKINLKSTNDQVIAVIKDQVKATVDNSFNVLRTRIDRFGVVQPNIQRLETNGRILIELPGVKEPERVRKLLQGSANLE